MMYLQCTRDKNEAELKDILRGCRHLVGRIDELHPTEENDEDYVFIIWAKNGGDDGSADKLFETLKKNAYRSSNDAAVNQLTLGIYSWSECVR